MISDFFMYRQEFPYKVYQKWGCNTPQTHKHPPSFLATGYQHLQFAWSFVGVTVDESKNLARVPFFNKYFKSAIAD